MSLPCHNRILTVVIRLIKFRRLNKFKIDFMELVNFAYFDYFFKSITLVHDKN